MLGTLFPSKHSKADDRPSQAEDPVASSIEALKTLQKTLHMLSPADKSAVKQQLPFAASEWLEGLALSIRAQSESCAPGAAPNGEPVIDKEKETREAARIRLTPDSSKVILVLVGLPARGKSTLCHSLEQFLGWRGHSIKSFKVGGFRRGGDERPSGDAEPVGRAQYSSASFFDSTKTFAMATRDAVTETAFDELLEWLSTPSGELAIFDACNVTIQRRAKLQAKVNEFNLTHSVSASIVFIESIVTDEEVISQEMQWKVKNSADFRGMAEDGAMKDLTERITHYEKVYQTVREEEGPYIKMFDLRAKVHACNVYGRMAKSVVPYMLAIHPIRKAVYMIVVPSQPPSVLSAEAEDESLSASLASWAATCPRAKELIILTSTTPRAISIAEMLSQATGSAPPAHRSHLVTMAKRDATPSASPSASADSAAALLPASITPAPITPAPVVRTNSFKGMFGESVSDLISRLEPIVLETTAATSPVCIVAHEAPCRTLRAFLLNTKARGMHERDKVDVSFAAMASDFRTPQLLEYTPHDDPMILGGCTETLVDLHLN